MTKLMSEKHLTPCLAQRRCSINYIVIFIFQKIQQIPSYESQKSPFKKLSIFSFVNLLRHRNSLFIRFLSSYLLFLLYFEV